jgi:cysteine desulfurase
MAAPHIYLDHNATTPIDPRVVEAMTRVWHDCGANPASQHAPGRKARRILEEAREGIADLLGAKTGGMDADQVIFASGGTEANNLAMFGLCAIIETKPGPGAMRNMAAELFRSALEHPSIISAVDEMRRRGAVVRTLPTSVDGQVLADAQYLSARQECRPHVISVMLANNETGVIQPVAEIAQHRRAEGVFIHSDAVQAVGKIPVNFRELGVDAMTVAPHKFHGPLGIGALVVRHGIKLQPQLFGGFQQGGLRPGTKNVALAAGFHEALNLAVAELPERAAQMKSRRDELEGALKNIGAQDTRPTIIIGEYAPRLPNTSCVSFPGLNRQALVMALDLAGVACSTGSACASGSSEPSPTLVAMGLPKDVIEGAIRLSLGAFTTAEEVSEAARRIVSAVKHLRPAK